MRPNRSWMKHRTDFTHQITEEFQNGVDEFIKIAKRDPKIVDVLGRIFCPCAKCKNCVREKTFVVARHLYKYGFMEGYTNWILHGEDHWGDSSSTSTAHHEEAETRNPYVNMAIDAMDDDLSEDLEEDPNPSASKIYSMIRDVKEPSQSYTSPTPPPPNTSFSPGATTNYGGWESAQATFYGKNDWKKRQKQGLYVNDEYHAYDDGAYDDGAYDDCEDEEIQLIRGKTNQQKSLRQQATNKNNSTKGIGGISGVSNTEKMSSAKGPPTNEPTSMPSSGGSHAEIDRRKTITVEAISNPQKGMKAWDGLVDIWLKPKWRKKSDANRCNRATLPDAVLHTGGSISFIEHKQRMEKELKHEVSYRDVYDRIHKNKDGEYVSRRSKNFIESYDTAMLEKYGDDFSTHPNVDSKVWEEVSGPNKKRRTLGGADWTLMDLLHLQRALVLPKFWLRQKKLSKKR